MAKTQIRALIDIDQKRLFFATLTLHNITFSNWLRDAINTWMDEVDGLHEDMLPECTHAQD